MCIRDSVYTFVNALGEEGPPSDPCTLEVPENTAVGLTLAGASGTPATIDQYPITKMRLYRTATGSDATSFLFVTEFNTGATVVYTDTKLASELVEPLVTQGYYPPPKGLMGLVSLPNGILAAFKKNEIWFSEPYLPYAWNPDNVLTTKLDVVALCPADGGFYAVTKGHPYFVSGVTPDAMGQIKLSAVQAGVSRKAICNIGPAVVWASQDGLVAARGVEASMDWSNRFFTRDEWQKRYKPKLALMQLTAHDGHLLATFTDGTPGFLLRYSETEPSFTRMSASIFATCVSDTDDAVLTIQFSNSQWTIERFKAGVGTRGFKWWSKDFILPKPINYGVLQVVGSGNTVIKVMADGKLRHAKSLVIDDTGMSVFRLPGGFTARRWSVIVEGDGLVTELSLAVSPEELRGV